MSNCYLRHFAALLSVGFIAVVLASCNREQSAAPQQAAAVQAAATANVEPGRNPTPNFGYFQTPWIGENHFIVASITQDIAGMAEYARDPSAPEPAWMPSVEYYREAPNRVEYDIMPASNPSGFPNVYNLRFEQRAIWDPRAYTAFTDSRMAWRKNDSAPPAELSPLGGFLSPLAEYDPKAFVAANRQISDALTSDFSNCCLHSRAAVLLGMFAMQERSGRYQDTTSILCRITAHLAMSHAFRPPSYAPTAEDFLAEALLETLMGRQLPATQLLNAVEKKDPTLRPWTNALRIRATMDYRLLTDWKTASFPERVEAINAEAEVVGSAFAVRRHADYFQGNLAARRAIANSRVSVIAGNVVLDELIPDELVAYASTFKAYHGREPKDDLEGINEVPKYGILREEGNKPTIDVIGWGQFAQQHQRHLCNAMVKYHDHLDWSLGLHAEARAFAAELRPEIAKLMYYPFLRQEMHQNDQDYRAAVDDMVKFARATPQFIGVELWGLFSHTYGDVGNYFPKEYPHPFANEYRWINPPPGTALETRLRRYYPSMTARTDELAVLHRDAAPTDAWIANNLLAARPHQEVTIANVRQMYGEAFQFHSYGLTELAEMMKDNPALRKEILLQAATIDVDAAYNLIREFSGEIDPAQLEVLAKRVLEESSDSVTNSRLCIPMVMHFLKKGDRDNAKKWAEFGREVYSGDGLLACGRFYEAIGDVPAAAKVYRDYTERYGDSFDEEVFYYRMALVNGRESLPEGPRKFVNQAFPKDLPLAKLADFNGQTPTGVTLTSESEASIKNGLHKGNIIVACNGRRVTNYREYMTAKDLNLPEDFVVIFHDGSQYREARVTSPIRKLGADLAPR